MGRGRNEKLSHIQRFFLGGGVFFKGDQPTNTMNNK